MSILECVFVLAAASADPPVAAQVVSGRFGTERASFDVQGAYAFRGTSASKSESAIIVALSNAGFFAPTIDKWLDRKQVIERTFKDDATAVVYFEFTAAGEFRGASYILPQGFGSCGFCKGQTTSTVVVREGRLVGRIQESGEARTFDLTLDVPVASDDHGAVLPEGGAEPGAAYQEYHAAAMSGPELSAGLRKVVSQRLRDAIDRAEKDGALAELVDVLVGQCYLDTVQIARGFATADLAVLQIKGQGRMGKRSGQALLVREQGGWRLDGELCEAAID